MEERARLVRSRTSSETSSKNSIAMQPEVNLSGGRYMVSVVISKTSSDTSSKISLGAMQPDLKLNDGCGEQGEPLQVPPASPPEPTDMDIVELLDCNDTRLLDEFHNEALKEAGINCVQYRILLACSLAVIGATVELSAIPFILPSAEIELCIQPHEKDWLVLISLVGASMGSLVWGLLGSRAGRRRGLVSCLAVNAVFASIATFMPTYGTFMMARFCSAIGSGGILPLTYTYLFETSARPCQKRMLPVLIWATSVGAVIASELANTVLPQTGEKALEENKNHFSAWHRYLLLCMLPIILSLILLIWTPESPRYLLDVGRESEAVPIYKQLQLPKFLRVCYPRKSAIASASYRLSELAPAAPAAKPQPPIHYPPQCYKGIWQALSGLFSHEYDRMTLSYGGILLLTTIIQFNLSAYIPANIEALESRKFEASKKIIDKTTFENKHQNSTLENFLYTSSSFTNCSFRDMLMSHVAFKNCTFNNVMFSNIRTSHTYFGGCTFINNTIIDADIEEGRELDPWCVLNNTIIRGMQGGCNRHADLTSKLSGLIEEQMYVAAALLLAGAFCLLPSRFRSLSILALVLIFLVPGLVVGESETSLYMVEAAYRVILTLIFFSVNFHVVSGYPSHLRCCALGVIVAVWWAGGAGGRGLGRRARTTTAILVTVLAVLNGLVTSCTLPT